MSPEGGHLVLVVGPSGAGKDTLLVLAARALAHDPRFSFPRRVVTRLADASEDHDTLDEAAFEQAERAGAFALSWRAHGLCYGIPAQALRDGHVVVCNVSRGIIATARRRFPAVRVVYVTAPPEVLAARLASRNRAEKIDERLARKVDGDFAGQADLLIDNSGTPEEGAGKLVAFLQSLRGAADRPRSILAENQ